MPDPWQDGAGTRRSQLRGQLRISGQDFTPGTGFPFNPLAENHQRTQLYRQATFIN